MPFTRHLDARLIQYLAAHVERSCASTINILQFLVIDGTGPLGSTAVGTSRPAPLSPCAAAPRAGIPWTVEECSASCSPCSAFVSYFFAFFNRYFWMFFISAWVILISFVLPVMRFWYCEGINKGHIKRKDDGFRVCIEKFNHITRIFHSTLLTFFSFILSIKRLWRLFRYRQAIRTNSKTKNNDQKEEKTRNWENLLLIPRDCKGS